MISTDASHEGREDTKKEPVGTDFVTSAFAEGFGGPPKL